MYFKDGPWITVWEITKNPSGKSTKIKASSSWKDKDTGEYKTDWNGFILLVGDAHKKAAILKQRDRIKLNGMRITSEYVKEQNKDYTNYTAFDFEMSDSPSSGGKPRKNEQSNEYGISDDDMPF